MSTEELGTIAAMPKSGCNAGLLIGGFRFRGYQMVKKELPTSENDFINY